MNITQFKSQLIAVMHGTTLNKIQNVNGLIERAGRDVLLDLDPQEMKRTTPITNGVFNSVYQYSCPSDLKGNKIIDIFPQVDRNLGDIWIQEYQQAFDIFKNKSLQDGFNVVFNNGVKSLAITSPTLPAPILINQCSTITANGTWSIGGDATDLSNDSINYQAFGSSLKFNLSASGSAGYIENSTMSVMNLADLEDQGTFFVYVYLPDASDFTSVNLRVGSSSTNYWSMSATANQAGNSFEDGWNLLAFNWASASQTGSPDSSNIDYARITFNYNGDAQTAVRVNNFFTSLATILNMTYYSSYLFKDASTGAWQASITDDSNIINLSDDSINLLFFKTAEYCAQQQQGINASAYDGPYFRGEYTKELKRYQSLYKSEVQKPQSAYYTMPTPNRRSGKIRYGY